MAQNNENQRNGNNWNRGLIVLTNLLLAAIITMIGYGGKEVITQQKEIVKQQIETTKAVSKLQHVLSEHNMRIENVENNDDKQDDDIEENKKNIHSLDKRVDNLDTRVKVLEK